MKVEKFDVGKTARATYATVGSAKKIRRQLFFDDDSDDDAKYDESCQGATVIATVGPVDRKNKLNATHHQLFDNDNTEEIIDKNNQGATVVATIGQVARQTNNVIESHRRLFNDFQPFHRLENTPFSLRGRPRAMSMYALSAPNIFGDEQPSKS